MNPSLQKIRFQTELGMVPNVPGARLLRLSGHISHEEAPALRQIIFNEIGHAAPAALVVDLGNVEHLDTAGLAVLIEGLMASQKQGLRMILCEPSESVLQVFELAGLHDALCCCARMAELPQKLTV